jgi:hypothetical protein
LCSELPLQLIPNQLFKLIFLMSSITHQTMMYLKPLTYGATETAVGLNDVEQEVTLLRHGLTQQEMRNEETFKLWRLKIYWNWK